MTSPTPYIPIVDELEVINMLLRDERRNNHLSELVPALQSQMPGGSVEDQDQRIIKRPPTHLGQYPSIEMIFQGTAYNQSGDQITQGFVSDRYRYRVRFDIAMGRNQSIIYNGVTYTNIDSPKALMVIYKVLHATLCSEYGYNTEPDVRLSWSDVRQESMSFSPGGNDYIDKFLVGYEFLMEIQRPYFPINFP